nr:centrosomal protein of 63 kDa [Pelodiscus sinensis]|eukprot:XP_025037640.1 centrosomal protein of 63 kDa [Pelodiscus sinensis]
MEALLERMQRQGHGRGFLTSCEAELQELMKQIDIMVSHKRSEWEGQTQALETCLESRERELSSVTAQLDEKHKEVGRLRQQLQHMEQVQQGMAVEYEQQLKKFQEELGKLKRSYEKLQKKQLKEAREGAKSHGDDRSEVSRLTKKIEEFRQKSLDWEKQRLLYQQQVASLEAQRKALAEQSELTQTQLASRKQVLESMQLASQSEIQHLTSKLERANDTICASELEAERLNMRVDDLAGANRKILEDFQRVQEELGHCKKTLQVSDRPSRSLEEHLRGKRLSKEFPGLEHALLQQNEKDLQSEVARLEGSLGAVNARYLQLSEELMEKCRELQVMEEHQCQAQAEMKKVRTAGDGRTPVPGPGGDEKAMAFHSGPILLGRPDTMPLGLGGTDCTFLGTYSPRSQQGMKDCGCLVHRGELEGMRREVSQLTEALHQRDIALASACGPTSDVERRQRAETERAERNAAEHGAKEAALTDLQESYSMALSKLDLENQQLQKDLAETRAKLELSTQVCWDKYESILQQMQNKVAEIQETESRRTQELQHKHEEERRKLAARLNCQAFQTSADRPLCPCVRPANSQTVLTPGAFCPASRRTQELQHKHEEERRKLQAKLEMTIQRYEEEIETLKAQHVSPGTGPVLGAAGGQSPRISRSSSKESLSSDLLLGADHLSLGPGGRKGFCDDESWESVASRQRELAPLCPLPTAPIGSIAARFLEEEEVRSQHILDRLDAHIEELKKESERTVRQFSHQK